MSDFVDFSDFQLFSDFSDSVWIYNSDSEQIRQLMRHVHKRTTYGYLRIYIYISTNMQKRKIVITNTMFYMVSDFLFPKASRRVL